MVLVITQQTFDEAVQENINDLGLSPEDAVIEAVTQFKAQGVDLSNVVTELGASADFENLNSIIEKLKKCQENYVAQDCSDLLVALKQECDKGIQYRVHAGRAGVYGVILDIFLKSEASKDVKVTALKAMVALMTKQPDLFEEKGAQVIMGNLEETVDPDIQKFILKWCKECCVMHEMNRQNLINLNIVEKLSALLQNGHPSVLKDTLLVSRALILDDDIRVEFGRAHEHARIIASETLDYIIKLIKKLKDDEGLVNDLILTLSSLLVRAEFCTKIDNSGGIELIQDVMTHFVNNEKIIRQCFKVIKALAGNDECKVHIIQKGLAPVISNSLNAHQSAVQTAAAGLNSVAALSLRCPDNSKALFEASLPEVIIEIMKKHPNEKSVQRTASWAIRNMVSRSRYQNEHFLELGVEELLLKNLRKFKEFEYDVKAALRDLECDVELKEEWTGKGGKISSETTIKKD
ncbi:armadillo repeat-containing protein 6 homolog [Zophobas morio]|uniref:armadillo repeat-containing protein 6 homolog n=1 Tax=Zophobas morio TaxID=2755281 RepID=UPI003083645C